MQWCLGRRANQSVSSGILYLLLVERTILDIKPLITKKSMWWFILTFSTSSVQSNSKIYLHQWLNSIILFAQGQKMRSWITLVSLISYLASLWDNHCNECCPFFGVFTVLSHLLFTFLKKSVVCHEHTQTHRHALALILVGMSQIRNRPSLLLVILREKSF